ncbi:MAG: leucine-rich repeat domain-containing protein [Clostridia bacterium]|nr:leucine-rich repeat domain-containing protein [Clostridia bacterium]
MKKKTILFIAIIATFMCFMALSVSAATTNEFGTVETSDTINLEGMATDTDVRIVLYDGTEYHTYPSRYIVTSSTSLALDFTKINEAFKKSYDTTSLIRIEVPRHVIKLTDIFNRDKADNLVEVFFPADSQLTSFDGWATFEGNTGLQKINIPKLVTYFNGNTFVDCTSLSEVTFDEGFTGTSLSSQQMFQNCKSLKKIVIPHSVVSFGRTTFSCCTALEEVVFSPNFTNVTGENMFSGMAREIGNDKQLLTIYIDDDFIKDTQMTNKIISWDNNDMKQFVIMFTGTKSEAEAFAAKFSGDQHLKTVNVVPYDPTKTSSYDYLGMEAYTPLTEGITVNTNRVIVYGYNYCDAFYEGEHDLSNDDGLCSTATMCARDCGKVAIEAKDDHRLIVNIAYPNNDYTVDGTKTVDCPNENCTKEDSVGKAAPIFEANGYSIREDGKMLLGGYSINSDALKEYNAYLKENGKASLKFGIVMSNSAYLTIADGKYTGGKGVLVEATSDDYTSANYTIGGFSATEKLADLNLVIALYVIDESGTSFVQNGTAYDEATASVDGKSVTVNVITLGYIAQATLDADGKLDEKYKAVLNAIAAVSKTTVTVIINSDE